MVMFTNEVAAACQVLMKTFGDYSLIIAIKDIAAAYDGIVFHAEEGTWKYWYETQTITKLEPWRSVKR